MIVRQPNPPSPGQPKPWTFPKNRLEDAIKIARAIEEKNAGNPLKADVLAKAVGYKQPQDWAAFWTCCAQLISTDLFRELVQTLRSPWNKLDKTL